MKALVPVLLALVMLGGCAMTESRSLASQGGQRIYGDPVTIYPGSSQVTRSQATTLY